MIHLTHTNKNVNISLWNGEKKRKICNIIQLVSCSVNDGRKPGKQEQKLNQQLDDAE